MFISLMSLDHPSAAKAGADFAALAARVNSCPFKNGGFSGTSKFVPFQKRRL
jgi:hypothetical protein